jgi:hypothetical protein
VSSSTSGPLRIAAGAPREGEAAEVQAEDRLEGYWTARLAQYRVIRSRHDGEVRVHSFASQIGPTSTAEALRGTILSLGTRVVCVCRVSPLGHKITSLHIHGVVTASRLEVVAHAVVAHRPVVRRGHRVQGYASPCGDSQIPRMRSIRRSLLPARLAPAAVVSVRSMSPRTLTRGSPVVIGCGDRGRDDLRPAVPARRGGGAPARIRRQGALAFHP